MVFKFELGAVLFQFAQSVGVGLAFERIEFAIELTGAAQSTATGPTTVASARDTSPAAPRRRGNASATRRLGYGLDLDRDIG